MNSTRKAERVAGLLYLLQIPLGVFGIMYISKFLVKPGNVSATISNILAHESMFRLSIVSAILCALITVATAFYIYKILRNVDVTIAKTIVIFTLIVTPISLLNELNNVAVLLLIKNTTIVNSFSDTELQSMILFFLELHKYGMQIIGIFFGLWLLPMGYLVIKSNFIPKIIGVLLLITCFGYLFDFTTFFLFPEIEFVVSEYTWLGEVLMVLWLLTKGINLKNQIQY